VNKLDEEKNLDELWKIAEKTMVEYDRVSDISARIGYYRTYVSCPKCHKAHLKMEITGTNTGATHILSCPKCGWCKEKRIGTHGWTREEYEEEYEKMYRLGGSIYARAWEERL
jgi:hypothetical protein